MFVKSNFDNNYTNQMITQKQIYIYLLNFLKNKKECWNFC